MKQKQFLLTTALIYANGQLHLGHLVENIRADIFKRFQLLRGHDCLLIGGSDCHGTPIMLNAEKQGITPEALINASRDAQMADNLISYMQRNPNEKVICWADNIHIINNISSVKKPIIKDFISMGSYIKNALKNEVYSLATIHANDSLLERTTWHSTPVLKGSFEDNVYDNQSFQWNLRMNNFINVTKTTKTIQEVDICAP